MYLWWAIAVAIFPVVEVKTFANIVPEWPRPNSNRFMWTAKHIRGPHENVYASPICFHLKRLESGKDDSSSEYHLQSSKNSRGYYLDPELHIFVQIFEFYPVPSPFKNEV